MPFTRSSLALLLLTSSSIAFAQSEEPNKAASDHSAPATQASSAKPAEEPKWDVNNPRGLTTKKVQLKALKDYKSDMLTITPEEEALGFKYVFQTKLTKETVGERLRGPLGMFDTNETYIDNNAQLVMNRLNEYYQ